MRGTVYFSAPGFRNRRLVIEWQGILCSLIALFAWIAVAVGGLHFVLLPRYYAGFLHFGLLLGWAIICLEILFRFINIITVDPGIVTKDGLQFQHFNTQQTFGLSFVTQGQVDVKESKSTAEFCAKCSFVRPARAHHCSKCGHCIRRMDHHCPWINNCVGINNHQQFVRLLRHVLVMCAVGTVFLLLEFYYFEPLELPQGADQVLLSSSQRSNLLVVYVVLDVIAVLAVSAFLLQQYKNFKQDKTTIEKKIEYWTRRSLKLKQSAEAKTEHTE